MTAGEETAYRALLRDGPATLAELASRTGTSAGALRRMLPRLEGLGLVTRLAGRPLRLLATPPHVAVDALVASRQEEIVHSRAAIGPLAAEAAPRHPEELLEVVSGRAAVARRYLRLQAEAKEELLVLVHPPFALDDAETSAEQGQAMSRGIRVRGIYGPRAFEDAGTLDYARLAIAAGEEARLGSVPIKLAIADRSTAMLPLTSEHAAVVDSSLVIHPSALLDALVSLFDALWQSSVPLPGAAPEDDVLPLLAAGLTDEAIARRLGVSPRTVQRRVHELTERLGARTRFQAGFLASRL